MTDRDPRFVEEMELVRRAYPEPEWVEGDKEIARSALRARIQASQGSPAQPLWGWRRPAWWLGAAAAAIATLLVAQVVLPPHGGGPEFSGASELRRLAAIAQTRPNRAIPRGAYLYSDLLESGARSYTFVSAGTNFSVDVRDELQSWQAWDGSGLRIEKIVSATFPTDADRVAWLADGSPKIPKTGRSKSTTLRPGDVPLFDLSDLPTDPGPLRAAIESGTLVGRTDDDADLFLGIGTLLAQGTASPGLRASLFQVAAQLSSVRSLGATTDPHGRKGVGVSVRAGDTVVELIFDPITSELLASQQILRGDVDLVGSSRTIYQERGLVSSIGDRPRSSP